MNKKKLKTINLKGKEYVQVPTRVEYFNEEYQGGSIETSVTSTGAGYIFTAKVTPDTDKPERFFTGHSYGEVGEEKAMEKLETVAVGRALAFMGIGIVEGIASAEEIDKFNKESAPQSVKKTWAKTADEEHTCNKCGDPAQRTYGVSKKGKEFNMIKCSQGHVEWLEVDPEEVPLSF